MRRALVAEDGVDVECEGCDACCTSSLFVHVRGDEIETLARVPRELAFPAPGAPAGTVVLGYDECGRCPMLRGSHCSIYAQRPATCRIYDCRVFTAAGIEAGGDDRRRISERAARWRFDYPTEADRREHEAVRAAARFIRDNAKSFPGGRVPSDPSQLAVLAVKSYEVFLDTSDAGSGLPEGAGADGTGSGVAESPGRLAAAVVEACRWFDQGGP
jgi:Fe-S-cluster containining protein